MQLIKTDTARNRVQLHEDVTSDDLRKTEWLLNRYPGMIDIIKNFELSEREMERGMSAYDMLSAEGCVAKRESGQELMADVTANSVVLKEKRHMTYKFYLSMSNRINLVIASIQDPHEKLIAKLLFIEGKSHGKAKDYLRRGYSKDIYPIKDTTFSEKRRRAIETITNSLLSNGTLDFMVIDYSRGRNKKGEVRFKLPGAEE